MCHRSGPVELCEKMLEYIKCATGPGPVESCEKNARIYKMWPQVRTCGIM